MVECNPFSPLVEDNNPISAHTYKKHPPTLEDFNYSSKTQDPAGILMQLCSFSGWGWGAP